MSREIDPSRADFTTESELYLGEVVAIQSKTFTIVYERDGHETDLNWDSDAVADRDRQFLKEGSLVWLSVTPDQVWSRMDSVDGMPMTRNYLELDFWQPKS